MEKFRDAFLEQASRESEDDRRFKQFSYYASDLAHWYGCRLDGIRLSGGNALVRLCFYDAEASVPEGRRSFTLCLKLCAGEEDPIFPDFASRLALAARGYDPVWEMRVMARDRSAPQGSAEDQARGRFCARKQSMLFSLADLAGRISRAVC